MNTFGAFILVGSVCLIVWLAASVSPIDRAEAISLAPLGALALGGWLMCCAARS